jgi:thioredoxin reductase (NADPH)
VLDAVVERIEGADGVSGLALKHLRSGAASSLAVEGAFIFVGTTPNTEFLRVFLPLDAKGFI